MGKRRSRKASKATAPPKKLKLDTAFDCPFCNHTGSVECSIDLKHRIAVASCGVCNERYCTVANALTEPVDVYSEWIDACERANEGVVVRRGYADETDDF
ncbi:transcription elongation factor 1 homolog [Phragmites australis]|uniref:transcription elongation factor 1 homolog n=1 Tax=Phragmites australis TaxID=29695 RepID=UPI002D7889F3|nr:transcription elongation factor 1 homolog [Phragmites australis]